MKGMVFCLLSQFMFDQISFRLRKDNHRKSYSHNGNRYVKQRYWYEELLVPRSTLWLGLGIAIDLAGLDNCNRLYCHDNCWHLYFPPKWKKGFIYLLACRIHYFAFSDMLDKRRTNPLALGKRYGRIIIWMTTLYLQKCQSWGILNVHEILVNLKLTGYIKTELALLCA